MVRETRGGWEKQVEDQEEAWSWPRKSSPPPTHLHKHPSELEHHSGSSSFSRGKTKNSRKALRSRAGSPDSATLPSVSCKGSSGRGQG